MKPSTKTLKSIFYLLVPFILGCNFIFPQTGEETAAPPVPIESTPVDGAASAFTITRIRLENGSLYDQLAVEAQKAKELHQTPILEFDATWCPPCIAIEKSLKAGDRITIDAFAGTYVIRADVDEWGWGDKNKFSFDGIPVYYKLDENGNPTGAVVDGDAWGENIPLNFAPVLDDFFHTP